MRTIFGDYIEPSRLIHLYHYISLPLKIGFNYGEKIYCFANIGIIPSFLVYASTHTPTIVYKDGKIKSERVKATEKINKFDLGSFAEIGGGYKFKGRYWLFISFIFQHSLTSITNGNYYNGSNVRLYAMKANIGFKYALTQ